MFSFFSLKKGAVVWLLGISIREINFLIIINSDHIKMSNKNAHTHMSTHLNTHIHTPLEVMKWLGYSYLFNP